jgi:hypothetical protein
VAALISSTFNRESGSKKLIAWHMHGRTGVGDGVGAGVGTCNSKVNPA